MSLLKKKIILDSYIFIRKAYSGNAICKKICACECNHNIEIKCDYIYFDMYSKSDDKSDTRLKDYCYVFYKDKTKC